MNLHLQATPKQGVTSESCQSPSSQPQEPNKKQNNGPPKTHTQNWCKPAVNRGSPIRICWLSTTLTSRTANFFPEGEHIQPCSQCPETIHTKLLAKGAVGVGLALHEDVPVVAQVQCLRISICHGGCRMQQISLLHHASTFISLACFRCDFNYNQG